MVVIRNAHQFETGRLAEIGFAAWEDAVAGWGEDVDALRDRASLSYRAFVRDYWPLIVVAETDDGLAGWGARQERDARITDLWVDPPWQGRGIGSALLETLEQAIREGDHTLALLQTHGRNARAIDLFKRKGYWVSAFSVKYSASLDHDIETVDMKKALM